MDRRFGLTIDDDDVEFDTTKFHGNPVEADIDVDGYDDEELNGMRFYGIRRNYEKLCCDHCHYISKSLIQDTCLQKKLLWSFAMDQTMVIILYLSNWWRSLWSN